MKREENGRMIFTEPEINQIRTLVANTQLTENGIKELEELENVVRMELESRLSKMAAWEIKQIEKNLIEAPP